MMTFEELTALLLLAAAMSFSPGPNTTLSATLGANFGFRQALPFICAVPLGWSLLLVISALGLGAVLMAVPLLALALKTAGVAYLLYLAWRLAFGPSRMGNTSAGGDKLPASRHASSPTSSRIGFWQGVLLQFVNTKAWMLALTIVSGWVAGRSEPGLRLLTVVPVLAAYAFASNALYALTGALLRGWLAGPEGTGRRLLRFNQLMALMLVVTAGWMALTPPASGTAGASAMSVKSITQVAP